MQQQRNPKISTRKLVTTKVVFIVTIIVITLTTLGIWLFGLGEHRTIFVNSILSTSILSITFFLFLVIGLFKGVKLKDDLGRITDKIKMPDTPDLSGTSELPFGSLEFQEGIAGFILGIIAWILFSILLLLFVWLFSAVIWSAILVFAAMLYWIFFRAVRLVFKNSNKCRGNLAMSFAYGLNYTVLYNFWIYGIILVIHYMNLLR